jgi:uncharacterized protein (TIRG00374 family)
MAWLLLTAGLAEVMAAMAGVDPWPLGLATVLNLIGPLLMAKRWQILLRARAVEAPYRKLYRSVFVANFFIRQFLPTTIGGDVLRVYDAWRLGASRAVALLSVGVDRFCGLATMLLFALIAGATADRLVQRWPLELGVALSSAALLFALAAWVMFGSRIAWLDDGVGTLVSALPRALSAKAKALWDALIAYRGEGRVLGQAMAWSIGLQLNVVLFYSLIGRSLRLPIGLDEYLLIVPLAWFVMLLPISINGIGIREGIFVLLLTACGATRAEAIAFAWLEYGLFLAFGIVGGLMYLLGGDTCRGSKRTAPGQSTTSSSDERNA